MPTITRQYDFKRSQAKCSLKHRDILPKRDRAKVISEEVYYKTAGLRFKNAPAVFNFPLAK